ncbi:transposase [Candidatus Peregrinibacteria bacterium]|nr:transposase [Candidatus Peregrinibacteria bacterium]
MKRHASRSYGVNTTYFLTTTVTAFRCLFHIPELAEILVASINFSREKFEVFIHAFVIMPNHFHLLLTVGEKWNVSEFMGGIKSFTSREVIKWCRNHRKLHLLELFQASAKMYKPSHKYQVWQERFDHLVVENENAFGEFFEYIHLNPLQEHWKLASSPEEYHLSSAGYYFLGKEPVIPITPIES